VLRREQLGVFRFVDDTHASARQVFRARGNAQYSCRKATVSGHVRAILERARTLVN